MEDQENLALAAGDADVPEAHETQAEEHRQEAGEAEANAANAGDDADAGAGEEGNDEEVSKSKRRREAQKQRLADAERERDEARDRLERIKAAAEGVKEPREADYEDYNEYLIAKALYSDRKPRLTQAEQEQAQRAQEAARRAQQEAVSVFHEMAAPLKAEHADYDEVVTRMPLGPNDQVFHLAMRSERAPELLYAIGKQPALAQRLAQAHPVELAMELGRMDAALAMPKPKTETSAPPPISPVRGKKRAERDPAKMSMSEYRDWRKSQGLT